MLGQVFGNSWMLIVTLKTLRNCILQMTYNISLRIFTETCTVLTKQHVPDTLQGTNTFRILRRCSAWMETNTQCYKNFKSSVSYGSKFGIKKIRMSNFGDSTDPSGRKCKICLLWFKKWKYSNILIYGIP